MDLTDLSVLRLTNSGAKMLSFYWCSSLAAALLWSDSCAAWSTKACTMLPLAPCLPCSSPRSFPHRSHLSVERPWKQSFFRRTIHGPRGRHQASAARSSNATLSPTAPQHSTDEAGQDGSRRPPRHAFRTEGQSTSSRSCYEWNSVSHEPGQADRDTVNAIGMRLAIQGCPEPEGVRSIVSTAR